ncbi:MAG: NADH:ubiquinone oxidoreductase [Chromatiaceae bacterium]|nr:MAG: NADH:ubiquinone oxidoreductase [Chromatiaceae bacterium]
MITPTRAADTGLIDDFTVRDGRSRLGTAWRLATDQVMGGVSTARMQWREIDGRHALCLSGDVRLENNGGFVQINLDLAPDGTLDGRRFQGIRLVVQGNGERYHVHLKTSATRLPWQSYRATFNAGLGWHEVRLPFDKFVPHRLVPALDVARLRRLGVVAIGQPMRADICVAEIGFYGAGDQ